MTTLLLVFVCLQAITTAASAELSGTCCRVLGASTEQRAAHWSHHQMGTSLGVPKTCSVYAWGPSLDGCNATICHCYCAWEDGETVQSNMGLWGSQGNFSIPPFFCPISCDLMLWTAATLQEAPSLHSSPHLALLPTPKSNHGARVIVVASVSARLFQQTRQKGYT